MNARVNLEPLAKTAFNEFKLRINGPLQEGAKRPPTLSVSVTKNQPRINVYTNIPNDKDNGRITGAMSTLDFFGFLVRLEKVIDGPNNNYDSIPNKIGAPGFTKQVSTTTFGKDAEGRVWLGLTAKDRPKIKFIFGPSEWHVYTNKEGAKYTEAELSEMYARGWCKLMYNLVPNVLDSHFVPYDPNDKDDAPKSNWNGNKGNSNKNTHFDSAFEGDDDLPM